eukprot:TRINITY_DN76234_c0_g1_i1.p1 TRINITY_DN76234_c0_g1~~TRINITY_DN76234_c0_g1_i1.p1  ORF type:complete len:197 (-),score=38.83 TRINITY_DN76234_c0_g1_i1:108-653(-)
MAGPPLRPRQGPSLLALLFLAGEAVHSPSQEERHILAQTMSDDTAVAKPCSKCINKGPCNRCPDSKPKPCFPYLEKKPSCFAAKWKKKAAELKKAKELMRQKAQEDLMKQRDMARLVYQVRQAEEESARKLAAEDMKALEKQNCGEALKLNAVASAVDAIVEGARDSTQTAVSATTLAPSP